MSPFRTPDTTPVEADTPKSAEAGLFPTSDNDPAVATRRMVERVFEAQTLDDLFDSTTGTSSDDLIGHTLDIRSVEWSEYNAENGPIPMATLQAYDETAAKAVEFISTSPMLTAFIRKAELIDQIPFRARIEGKRTRSGQTALNFVRP